ncbi:MAG: RluA family pseudouridine synthase [Coriobacteriia bacterium]|nr:RluA family pseudouridine synthase [Coriobacteriia bacterium]
MPPENSEQTPRVSCRVCPEYDGATVAEVLRQQLHIGRKTIRHARYIEGAILVDGQAARTDAHVHAGQSVSIRTDDALVRASVPEIAPEHGPLEVLYLDECFIAVNKPAGMVVHPRVGNTEHTLANYIAGYLEKQGIPGNVHPLHRIDAGTTGIVLFALSSFAQSAIQEQLHRSFERDYLAICTGWIEGEPQGAGVPFKEEGLDRGIDPELDLGLGIGTSPDFGLSERLNLDLSALRTIDAPIARRSDCESTKFAVVGDAPCVESSAKEAVTHFMTLAQLEGKTPLSLVRLRLGTGRTHQIRVHMAHLGHPLLGDPLYGTAAQKENVPPISRPALHSWSLRFQHPLSKEEVRIQAPLPADMRRLLPKGIEAGLD